MLAHSVDRSELVERQLGFDEYVIEAHGLSRRGRNVPIAPKPLALLRLLASRSGQVVGRETLLAEIWGEQGSDEGLTRCVYLARLALGDIGDRESPRFIEAVYGVGYRFLRPVS